MSCQSGLMLLLLAATTEGATAEDKERFDRTMEEMVPKRTNTNPEKAQAARERRKRFVEALLTLPTLNTPFGKLIDDMMIGEDEDEEVCWDMKLVKTDGRQ